MEATAAAPAHATAVAARVAAICDKIKEHRDVRKPMSARHVAVICAMIDNIAATDDAKGTPKPKTGGRKKARKGGARWNEELSRLDEAKSGVVVKYSGNGGVGDILREACFMAACRGHPSVLGYCGVTRTKAGTDAEDDDYSLVVDVVRDHGRPFPEADVRRIMRHLLAGVEAMAEHGVVHRDIKPANILYVSGAFKIAGFGAAEKDPPRQFPGTNGYTAPEVLLENTGAWSLGCIMLQLLTGCITVAAGHSCKIG